MLFSCKKIKQQLNASDFVFVFHQQSEGTVSSAGSSGGDPAADYSSGANHVLAVIHQILGHHRALEARYHQARLKLHQRLALLLYKEDCRQVSKVISASHLFVNSVKPATTVNLAAINLKAKY